MAGSQEPGFTALDHTADVGISVFGRDLNEVFRWASLGLFSQWAELETVAASKERPMEAEAEDLPGLLVNWLSEINYLHEIERELYCKAEVSVEWADGIWRAKGRVFGEPMDPQRHCVQTEIKAVTYHELLVEPCPGGYRAQVIFDV